MVSVALNFQNEKLPEYFLSTVRISEHILVSFVSNQNVVLVEDQVARSSNIFIPERSFAIRIGVVTCFKKLYHKPKHINHLQSGFGFE